MSSTSLTVANCAQELMTSEQNVRKLLRERKLTGEKLGGRWVVPIAELEKYLSTIHSGQAKLENHYKAGGNNNKRKALSFFSGAMGLDLGLEEAGFSMLLASEIDKACRETISINRPEMALIGDVRDYTAIQVRNAAGLHSNEDIDLVVGGPPCQAFSSAGKRLGFEDERGNVFLKFIDLVTELMPKFAVIENVRGLLSAPLTHRPHSERGKGWRPTTPEEVKGGALRLILAKLESHGYSVSFNLYNAANFGTPQVRERVVLICSRERESVPFLTPTHSKDGSHGLLKWRTVRDALDGLDGLDHDHLDFPERRLKYYRMLSEGQYWKHLPIEVQKEAMGKSFYCGGGRTGFFRRVAWDKPSPTLVTHPAMPATDLAHPELDRPLSVQEYRRLQEFPESWQIAGTLLNQYKQIGNAVPVGLGRAIGIHLKALLDGKHIEQIDGFRYSRYRNTDYISWKSALPEVKKATKDQLELELSG